ncbi:MAG: DUF2934 domain-containing protein [Acidobacteriia bacterium]|nr:DUF2934 domain-containing protein [Terriglobia bacterium]
MKKHEGARTIPATRAAVAVAFERVPESGSRSSAIEHEETARLAYSYWEARGCPYGSPQEDWFRAEMDLLRQTSGAAA